MYLLDPALNWAQGQPKDAQLSDTGVVLDLTGGGKSEISIENVNPSTGGKQQKGGFTPMYSYKYKLCS